MYALSNARGKGDYRLAAFHAEKIAPGFNDLYLRVLYTKDEKEESQDEDATLLSCIEALDAGEASRKLLVMAVDDSPAILEAVAAVLNVDYRVFKLPKPDMLETVLKQVEPELFLLDYHMPGLSGFELIPIIRTLPKHKDTPIIFLTSEGTIDNVTAAIALGACDFIVKPFHPDQLLEKVARHIVRKNNLL
jgi:PleD family two-component response regulator